MSRNAPQFVTRLVLPEVIDGVNIGLKQLCTMRIPETLIAASDVYTVFNHARPLGISPGYDKTGRLIAISVSDGDNCRIIEFAQPPGAGRQGHRANPKASPPPPKSIVDGRKKLQDQMLCRIMGGIYAFDMGPLAMSLHVDLNLRISNAVDIQSSFSAHDRSPLSSVEACVGKEPDPIHKIKIKANKLDKLFLQPIYDPEADPNSLLDLAERAWLSQFLPSYAETAFDQAKRINTEMMESSYLSSISKISNDSVKLDQKKPTQMTHKFSQSIDPSTNQVRLISSEYGSRIRGDKNIKMTVTGPNGEFRTKGTVAGSSGRSSTVNTDRQLTSKAILTVTSVGRDDKTSAEAQRDATILRFLQGTEKTSDNPWYQNIWSPANADGLLVWPKEWSQKPSQPPRISKKPAEARLNGSQQTAVNCMLSVVDDHRIVLVQGPPGTGKTSVIASFVDFSVNAFGRTGIWLVAQSNVAVKNIAEKLISSGFLSWKLLVSKDFHFEWHEHLYAKVLTQNVIRSEAFRFVSPKDLKDTNVILCTISMLSNAQIKKFTRSIPVRTLVVDEASQIEVGNYISIFSQFQSTLRKKYKTFRVSLRLPTSTSMSVSLIHNTACPHRLGISSLKKCMMASSNPIHSTLSPVKPLHATLLMFQEKKNHWSQDHL
ncbi:hypothetical protein CPC08DRAFT_472974 [Agrocybe pediades]|nr:hypothetical protein CPC08DRAFT_472974 [Agrocybe pediades]